MLNYEGEAFTPSQSEEEQEQCFVEDLQGPGDIFLAGEAVRSEISLKDLSPEDRAKYDDSMAKEWSSWQKFNAVEILSPQQIEDLPEDAKIIGTDGSTLTRTRKSASCLPLFKAELESHKLKFRKSFHWKRRAV